jgi:nucleoside-diphosphate-sugar epimerase
MHVLVTGGTGQVGRFIVEGLRAAGHRVTLLGRSAPPGVPVHAWSLAETDPRLPAADALVHAALDHAPGAYRGGEGEDPARFRRLNVEGTRALFDAAGGMRIVFLSSRAVYGDHRHGAVLRETDTPEPDSLYGEVKLAGEAALAGRGLALRATGVYGGLPDKWADLFARYLAGEPVAPRIGTEVHGADLADAVAIALARTDAGPLNVSDLLLDRHDLLARVQALTGCPHPLPARAEGDHPGVMATDRLRALGWRPGGAARLDAYLGGAANLSRSVNAGGFS